MTEKLRIRIAAVVTALFLAGISVAGVLAHTNNVAASAVSQAQTTRLAQPTAGAIPSPTTNHENND